MCAFAKKVHCNKLIKVWLCYVIFRSPATKLALLFKKKLEHLFDSVVIVDQRTDEFFRNNSRFHHENNWQVWFSNLWVYSQCKYAAYTTVQCGTWLCAELLALTPDFTCLVNSSRSIQFNVQFCTVSMHFLWQVSTTFSG